MSKRQRFVATSLFLSLLIGASLFLDGLWRYLMVIIVASGSLVAFYWSLAEAITTYQVLMVLILPFSFTLGLGLFSFLLPINWLTAVVVVPVYALSTYFLMLVANIYGVSAVKRIALVRTAKSVGFIYTMMAFFFTFSFFFALRLAPWISAPVLALLSLPLLYSSFWSTVFDQQPVKKLLLYSGCGGLVIAQATFAIFFWPVTPTVAALFVTAVAYLLIGLGQDELDKRLFAATLSEYLKAFVLIALGVILSSRWRG